MTWNDWARVFASLLGVIGSACAPNPQHPANEDGGFHASDGSSVELDCGDACSATASRCGAPRDMIASGCTTLCAKNPSREQLACLLSASCEELFEGFARNESVCGIGAASDAGIGGGDASLNMRDGNGACQIGDRRCIDDFTAFRCESVAGFANSVTERCSTPCERGYCIDPSRPGTGSTCSDATDCRAPQACEGRVCCVPENEICISNDDCCGGRRCVRSQMFDFSTCR